MKPKLLCLAMVLLVSLMPGPGAVRAADEPPTSVLAVFALDGSLTEKPMVDDFPFGSSGGESLKDLVARMKKARDDKNVKAVVLLADSASLRMAQVEEIRRAMDEIKAAGKEIHAHADSLSTGRYMLLSGASRLSVVPAGDVSLIGLRDETPYLRGLLDLLGVKPDYLTCGAYKSAAEVFMRKGPSAEAEAMENWLLDSLYQTGIELIASGRRVPAEKARAWIDGAPYSAESARQAGIIDDIQHRQDFLTALKKKYGEDVKLDRRYGKKKAAELDLSSPLGVFKLWADLITGPKKPAEGKEAVAIVYVEGPIMTGKSEPSFFGAGQIAYSTEIRKALDKAAGDKSIKALVLRVNSPGGSAVASEIILDATRRVKAAKPLVVSMGSVAGSGGYYVACAADTIFADAATITASIGVVGGKFATTDMWNKVGITWKSNHRGASAPMYSSDAIFTPQQRAKLQGRMNEIYAVFKGHVTAIRGNRLKKPIDELAGGRVFTGRQALELGLVDRLGTLEDAIEHAAKLANVKDYEVRVVPRPKSFMEVLLADLGEKDKDEESLSLSLGARMPRGASLFEAAMPYLRDMEPERLRAVETALGRLAMLQQEGVLLMMPEMLGPGDSACRR